MSNEPSSSALLKQRQRFEEVCSALNLNQTSAEDAWTLVSKFVELEKAPVEHDMREASIAAAIYLNSSSRFAVQSTGVTLSQILRECKVSLVDFFEPLKYFAKVVEEDFSNIIKVEKKFVVSSLLYPKYLRLWQQFFQVGTGGDLASAIFSFAEILSDPPDLLQSYQLLICIVYLLYINIQPELRRVALQTLPLALHQLCQAAMIDLQEIDSMLTSTVLKHFTHPKQYLRWNTGDTSQGLFPELLRQHLQYNRNTVDRSYDMLMAETGDFDERLLLTNSSEIGTPGVNRRRGWFRSESSNSGIPSTPLSMSLALISWLRDAVRDSPPSPSAQLKPYLYRAGNLEADLVARLSGYSARVTLPDDRDATKSNIALSLYYKLLLSMLQAEEKRLGRSDFHILLRHEVFHKSLLACCFEIVIFCFKIVELPFPAILDMFGLAPFDFLKVIESVVKHHAMMTEVATHLGEIEQSILESLAWQDGSPLYTLIETTAPSVESIQTPSKHVANPSLPPVAAYASPAPNRNPLPTPNPNPGKRSVTLDLFTRKVFYLASVRTRDLCQRVNRGGTIIELVNRILTHIFTEKPSFMMNRHIDHVIVCSIYGACKLKKQDIKFRDIIDKYREQPQASSKVFREVPLSSGQMGDIIKFYNEDYIPTMEPIFHQKLQELEAEPKPISRQNIISQSPFKTDPNNNSNKIINGNNNNNSSYKVTAVESPMMQTNSAIKLGFGQWNSPARELHAINRSVKGVAKRLDFGDSPKRQRLDS